MYSDPLLRHLVFLGCLFSAGGDSQQYAQQSVTVTLGTAGSVHLGSSGLKAAEFWWISFENVYHITKGTLKVGSLDPQFVEKTQTINFFLCRH